MEGCSDEYWHQAREIVEKEVANERIDAQVTGTKGNIEACDPPSGLRDVTALALGVKPRLLLLLLCWYSLPRGELLRHDQMRLDRR